MKIRILVINDDCLSAEAISNERLARGFGLNTRLITKADFLQSARYNRLMALDAMLSEHVLFTLEDIYGSHYEVINSTDGENDPRIGEEHENTVKRSFEDALFLDNFEFYSLQEHSFFDVEFINNNFDGVFFFLHHELSRERGLNQSLIALFCAIDCPPIFMFNLALEKESLRYLVQDCEAIISEGAIAANFMNADHYGQFEYFMRVVLPKAHRVYFINEEQRVLVSRYYDLLNECLGQNRQDEITLPPFKLSCNGYLNFRRSEAILTAARAYRIIHDYKEHGFDIKHIIGYTDSYLIKEEEKSLPEDPLFSEPEFDTFGDSRMVLNTKHFIDVGHNSPDYINNNIKKYTFNACGIEINEDSSNKSVDPASEHLSHERIPMRDIPSRYLRSSCSSQAVIEGYKYEADSLGNSLEEGVITTNEMLNEADINAHLNPCSFNCPKVFKDEFIASGRHRFTVAISSKFFGYNPTLGMDIRGINLIRSVCDAFPNARIVLFLNENLYSFLDDIPHSDTIIHEQTDCFIRAHTIKMRQMSKVLMGDVDSAGSLSFAVCSRVNRSLNQHIKTQLFLEQEAFKGENAPVGMDRFNGCYYGKELQEKVERLNNIVDDCFINLDYQGLFKTDVDLLISDHLHERVVAQSNGVAAFKLKYNEDNLKEKVFLTKDYLEAFLAATFDFDLVPPLYVQFQGLSSLISNEMMAQAQKQNQHLEKKREIANIVGKHSEPGPHYFFAKDGIDYEEPCEQLPQSELLPSISLEGLLLHGRSVRDQILGLAEKFDLKTLNEIILKYEKGCQSFERDLKTVFKSLYSSKHMLPTNLLDDTKDEEPTLTPEEMSEAGFTPEVLENFADDKESSTALESLGERNLDVGDVNNVYEAGFSKEENQQEIEEASKGLRVAQQSNFTYGKRYELQWSFLRFMLAMMHSCVHRPELRSNSGVFKFTNEKAPHDAEINISDLNNNDRGSTMAYTLGEFDREFVRERALKSASDPALRGLMEDRLYSDQEETSIKPITLLEEYVPPLFKPMSLSILSFGCSRGEEVMDLLSYFNGQSIKGVDISAGAISKARQMLKNLRRLNRFEMLVEFKKLYHLGSKFYDGYTAPVINNMVQHKINLGTVELLAKNEWLCKSFGTESKIFTEFLGNLRPSGGVVKHTGLIGYIEFMTSNDYFEQRDRFCNELQQLKDKIRETMSDEDLELAQNKIKDILLAEMRNTLMVRDRSDEVDKAHLQFVKEIDQVLSAAFSNVQSRSASFLRNLYNAYAMLNALYDDKVFECLPEVMFPDFSDRNLSHKMKTNESELSAAFNQAKSARDLMDASSIFEKSRSLQNNDAENVTSLSETKFIENEDESKSSQDVLTNNSNKEDASFIKDNAQDISESCTSLSDSYAFVERIKVEQYDALTAMTVLCRHPETTKLTNAHHIYPFGEFEALLTKLASMVRTGGFLCIFNANYRLEDTALNDKFVRVFPFYDNTIVTSLVKMDSDKEKGLDPYDAEYKSLRVSPNSSLNDYAFEFFHKLTQLHFNKDERSKPHTICVPEDLRRMYESTDSFNKFGHTALFDGNEKRIIRKDIGSIFLKIKD